MKSQLASSNLWILLPKASYTKQAPVFEIIFFTFKNYYNEIRKYFIRRHPRPYI